jgi:hypothetical protein
MFELNVFKEIAGNERYHSCILATYSLDFYFFEQRIVRILRSKGIRNISVIADGSVLEECMGQMMQNVKKISSLYSLTTVITKGAFHPKLYMFFGDNDILLIIGSGNLTAGGMGKNHESFISFAISKDNQDHLPIILQAWHYLETVCEEQRGISIKQIQWIRDYCSFIKSANNVQYQPALFSIDAKTKAAFLNNLNGGIWENLKGLINEPGNITRISIASPFFDKQGDLLRELEKKFPNATIDIYIQKEGSLLPLNYAPSAKVHFYDWDVTEAALEGRFKHFDRFQHGKLFHFKSVEDEYLLMGSANATNAAFLNDSVIKNYETAILLYQNEINWLDHLGIRGEKVAVDHRAFSPTVSRDKTAIATKSFLYKIQSIDRVNKNFRIYLNQVINHQNIQISLFDCFGNKVASHPINKITNEIIFSVQTNGEAEQIVYGQLQDETGFQISNSQVINNVSAIENLHPSPENRKVYRLIEKMMSEKYSGLDLFDLYDTIYNEKENEQKRKGKQRLKVISQLNNDNAKPLTSEEAWDLAQKEDSALELKKFEPGKILDAYVSKLQQLMQKREDADIDDEEDGNIKNGGGREDDDKPKERKPLPSEQAFIRAKEKIVKVFRNYINGLSKATENADSKEGDYKVSLSDYAFFLLLISHLIDITGKEYSYKIDEKTNSKVLLPLTGAMNGMCSFESITINVIGKFLLFLHDAKGGTEYKNEYELAKLGFLRENAFSKILLCIALLREAFSLNAERNSHKWLLLLLINAVEVFKEKNAKISELIRREFKICNITQLDLSDTTAFLDKMYIEALAIIKECNEDKVSSNFLFTVQLGYCYAEKFIPTMDNLKFLRVSHPGLAFDGKDFIHTKLYDWKNFSFLPSFKGEGERIKANQTITKDQRK